MSQLDRSIEVSTEHNATPVRKPKWRNKWMSKDGRFNYGEGLYDTREKANDCAVSYLRYAAIEIMREGRPMYMWSSQGGDRFLYPTEFKTVIQEQVSE